MPILIDQPVGLLLTANGDRDFSALRSQYVRGVEGAIQGARERMYLIRGELFYDLGLGVPWMARDGVPATIAILGQRFSESKTRAALRPAILSTPGISAINSMLISFDTSTRQLSVTWSAKTIWGDTDPDILDVSI